MWIKAFFFFKPSISQTYLICAQTWIQYWAIYTLILDSLYLWVHHKQPLDFFWNHITLSTYIDFIIKKSPNLFHTETHSHLHSWFLNPSIAFWYSFILILFVIFGLLFNSFMLFLSLDSFISDICCSFWIFIICKFGEHHFHICTLFVGISRAELRTEGKWKLKLQSSNAISFLFTLLIMSDRSKQQ